MARYCGGFRFITGTRESEPQEPNTGLLKQQDFGNRIKRLFSMSTGMWMQTIINNNVIMQIF